MIVVLGGLADVERDHPGVSKLKPTHVQMDQLATTLTNSVHSFSELATAAKSTLRDGASEVMMGCGAGLVSE